MQQRIFFKDPIIASGRVRVGCEFSTPRGVAYTITLDIFDGRSRVKNAIPRGTFHDVSAVPVGIFKHCGICDDASVAEAHLRRLRNHLLFLLPQNTRNGVWYIVNSGFVAASARHIALQRKLPFA
jgi:hypothetical protein